LVCIPILLSISNQRYAFLHVLSTRIADIEYPPKFVTGKQFLFGYDVQNRPALYMLPSRQNTEPSDRQIQQVVWVLERATDLMAPGTELVFQHVHYPLHELSSHRSTLEPWRS